MGKRVFARAALGLAVLAAALFGGLTLDHAAARNVVVGPQQGATVGAHPVKVVVRAHDRLFDLHAKLNGKSVAREFGPTVNGKRRATLSRSHALRHGENLLRVAARRSDGTWRKQMIRFTVSHRRPLAGADRDRQIVEGVPMKLIGSAKAAPGTHGRMSYRWNLLSAPKDSKLRRSGRPLSDPTARRPRFTPDVRGAYRFELTVSQHGRSTADRVTYDAVTAPDVSLERVPAARGLDGAAAIAIGGTEYPADTVADAWLQVVVLDRSNLGTISNQTYTCAAPPDCGGELAGDLAALDDTELVIAMSHPGFVNPYDLPDALAPIGFPDSDPAIYADAPGGSVSIIGVPGMEPGEADVSFSPTGAPGGGLLTGSLTLDQYSNYGFMPTRRAVFDTRASGESATQNVLQVDGKPYVGEVNSDLDFEPIGALHVAIFDGHTLAYRDNGPFYTNWAPSAKSDEQQIVSMIEQVQKGMRPGDVVVVSSVDTGGRPLDPGRARDPGAYTAAANRLAGLIESLGGTRDTFLRAATDPHGRYSLVGWAGAGAANGEETSALKNGTTGSGRLRGALSPDAQGLFKPVTTSATGEPNETLQQLLLKPKTDWPLANNPGAQKAMSWIGGLNRFKKLGPDPRSAYWIQDFEAATWYDLAEQVGGVTYPGNGNGFTEPEFNAGRNELSQELNWVGNVRDYLDRLSKPFSQQALPSWANMTVITDDVTSALKPPDRSGEASIIEMWGKILEFATLGGSEAVEVVAMLYSTASGFLTQERDGSPATEVRAESNKLAAELISRMLEVQKQFKAIGDIIVSDYGKLSVAGINALCNPGPNCPTEWSFTSNDQARASVATFRGVEAEFDEALMKLSFPTWTLPAGSSQQASAYECPAQGFSSVPQDFRPFGAAGMGQAALFTELPGTYHVQALGADTTFGGYDNWTPAMPPSGTTQRMFGAVGDPLNAHDGGLGIHPADYLPTANPRAYPTGFFGINCSFR